MITITSDYDKNYSDKVAEHLAKNYDKGVWDHGNMVGMSQKDFRALEDRYNQTVFNSKKKYQKELNSELVSYLTFGLKKPSKGPKVTMERFKEIVHYKVVYRTKKAFRDFLYK